VTPFLATNSIEQRLHLGRIGVVEATPWYHSQEQVLISQTYMWWLGTFWKHSNTIFWNNQQMPYLRTRGAVEVTHLISFLGDSNQQMPNVGTMDTVMPFQADTPAVWTFFSAFIFQDMYIGHSRSHYFLARCVQLLATVMDSHRTTWSWTLHCILVALLAVFPYLYHILPPDVSYGILHRILWQLPSLSHMLPSCSHISHASCRVSHHLSADICFLTY
jgi:hypothetical protein